MVEGKEVERYKNIELPDVIKEIPSPRTKMTRAEKAATKTAKATSEQTDPIPISPGEWNWPLQQEIS